MLEKNIKVKRN